MEESQISVFDFIEEDLMKKKEFDSREAEDVADMIRGVSPENILISFGDKPAKPLEEYVKEQKKENTFRKKHRNDMER